MARPLVAGNGRLLVCLDRSLTIRDFYWPFVGLHNHLSGNRARTGVWVEGRFAWMGEHEWRIEHGYEDGTLVTRAAARHDGLGITIHEADCVHHRMDALLRRFRITNHDLREREVRLFLCHDFHIAESDIADTVFYHPFVDALVHFKRDTYLLMAMRAGENGIFQYAAGISGFGGAEGTWRDAEDGCLTMNAVAQGSVDSTMSARVVIPAEGTKEIHAWICAAHTLDGAIRMHRFIERAGIVRLQAKTNRRWASWSQAGSSKASNLPQPIPELFRRSLLAIRCNIDSRGAIIAANDSDIMETARAHYSYMWPRDGALVAAVLDRLDYRDITRRFFLFCQRALPRDRAALLHKYMADGTWGSTWHPWVVEGEREVPFQEDSTALVVWALNQRCRSPKDLEFAASVYDSLLIPCADFLADFRNPDTGLPHPSYDLWEERRGVHAYTCGTVYGALAAAARLAGLFGDARAARYREAAEQVRAGIEAHLWCEEAGRYARRLVPTREGGYELDLTVDSALHALWMFGAQDARHPRIEATMRRVISRLWVQTDVGGIARYENDYYFRRRDDIDAVPGNPWIICTLWAAQWYIARAESAEDLVTALDLLLWTARRTLPGGMLPEQVHPDTGDSLSVAPLTWSHAEFVATVLDYAEASARFMG